MPEICRDKADRGVNTKTHTQSQWMTYHRSQGHVKGVRARQSKVCDLNLPATADEDVVRLQVPVHHQVAVQEVQTEQQL